MDFIYQVIDANMTLVYFIYGLVYFVFGLAIVLQQRSLSNFRLARHLWLLAAFGIIHGIMEWGNVFIPIQATYLSEAWIDALYVTQDIARAVSFAFLLQFAVTMLVPRISWIGHKNLVIRIYAPLWSIFVSVIGIVFIEGNAGEHWIRYLLAFPAAALTAVAFFMERKAIVGLPQSAAKTNLVMTSIAFLAYAVVGGLVVPENTLPWPLEWLHYENVFSTTGFPIQLYRAAVGLAMAFFIIRSLSIFDIELRNRVELTERNQVLLEDRHRIARDLHDGVVQSIYAAGLQLEVATDSLPPGASEAKPIIDRVKVQLNEVIADIRRYIFELGSTQDEKSALIVALKRMLDEFSSICPTETSLEINGEIVVLSQQHKQNIILITRECLANVAKHSLASRVGLRLDYKADGLKYVFMDNGVGIESDDVPEKANRTHGRGLENMASRAGSMGSTLTISSGAGGEGTVVTMWVPYEDEEISIATISREVSRS
ncbi:MAG: hypothetical protein HZB44_07555 [Actinobacteria bacterium]|nr:hypothetical protein [Actinomycetota bacterium]